MRAAVRLLLTLPQIAAAAAFLPALSGQVLPPSHRLVNTLSLQNHTGRRHLPVWLYITTLPWGRWPILEPSRGPRLKVLAIGAGVLRGVGGAGIDASGRFAPSQAATEGGSRHPGAGGSFPGSLFGSMRGCGSVYGGTRGGMFGSTRGSMRQSSSMRPAAQGSTCKAEEARGVKAAAAGSDAYAAAGAAATDDRRAPSVQQPAL